MRLEKFVKQLPILLYFRRLVQVTMTWSILLLMVGRTLILTVLRQFYTISDIEGCYSADDRKRNKNGGYCILQKDFSVQTFSRKTKLSEL